MYNYIGPTWAERSFDPEGIAQTNFARVWNYPNNTLTYPSTPPGTIVNRVKGLLDNNPVVWIYSDPWGDIPWLTGIPHSEFVCRADWFDIWRDANQQILRKINQLGVPVLLIGAHCDVIDCDFANITVAHPSWQMFMAESLGLVVDQKIQVQNRTIEHCIAQEIYFGFFHANPDIEPDSVLKDLVIDQWMLWDQFHQAGLMWDHHPTNASYTLFAEALRPQLNEWLNNVR